MTCNEAHGSTRRQPPRPACGQLRLPVPARRRTRAPAGLAGLLLPAVLACAGLLAAGCAPLGPGAGDALAAARAASARAASPGLAGPAAGTAAPGNSTPGSPSPGSPTPGSTPASGPVSRQLITVTAPAYGATYAILTVFGWAGDHWQRVLGPWPARIGRNGMAPPDGKREGDGRTPSGTFTVPFLFGTGPDPGFAVRYRQSHPWIAWDDDPASARYNEWVDTRYHDPGTSPEPMDVSAYVYGAVIGYNRARTPGLGSAIFLHASIGTATAGCVTLPVHRLLRVLRWLNPRLLPRIRMGVG